jgi:hypothetical protein
MGRPPQATRDWAVIGRSVLYAIGVVCAGFFLALGFVLVGYKALLQAFLSFCASLPFGLLAC